MNGLHKDLPNRKSIRLNGYDYSQNGLYFITFCIHNKNCYLGKITGNIALDGSTDYSLVLSGTGEIVKSILETASDRFENIKLDAYCIMPNHVHMVLTVFDDSLISDESEKRSLVSKIIGYIKMNSAKQIRRDNPFISGVWQRGYHDHIIRDEKDYIRIMSYIRSNIQRWKEDVFYKQDNEVIIGKISMRVYE